MKKRFLAWMTVLLGWIALASCQSQQVVIPSNFTVKAAPGAPGVSRDTAEEFLKRAPFPNVNRNPHHEGLCYAEPFYHDATLDPAGKDTDPINGVDTATLFFNASHGTAETWLAMPYGRDPVMCPQSASETHVVDSKSMKLGNGKGTGDGLRYFWQCASNVFAHGPRQCPGGVPDFGCPEGFDGTQDTLLARNVYEQRVLRAVEAFGQPNPERPPGIPAARGQRRLRRRARPVRCPCPSFMLFESTTWVSEALWASAVPAWAVAESHVSAVPWLALKKSVAVSTPLIGSVSFPAGWIMIKRLGVAQTLVMRSVYVWEGGAFQRDSSAVSFDTPGAPGACLYCEIRRDNDLLGLTTRLSIPEVRSSVQETVFSFEGSARCLAPCYFFFRWFWP